MKSELRRLGAAVLCVLAWAPVPAAQAQVLPERTRVSVLEARLASLEAELGLIEDVEAVKRLQAAYGYYRSKAMADELAALFSAAPGASLEVAGRGIYLGRDRIRAFFAHPANRLEAGDIHNLLIAQAVVHVAPDGKTAKGRFRALIQSGSRGEDGRWIEGPFENEYVKEDGVWKISKLHWFQTVNGSYDQGWHKLQYPPPGTLADLPPDLPPSDDFKSFPDAYFKPFHYRHPVTDEPVHFEVEGAQ